MAPLASMDELRQAATEILAARRGATADVVLHPLPGGRNNRVFRVDSGAERYLLKVYFHVPEGGRDRLGAEYPFAELAWSAQVPGVAEPIGCDRRHHVALFAWIDGRRLDAAELTINQRDAAIDWLVSLNRAEVRADVRAASLGNAAESCFSLDEHLALVERRLHSLRSIDRATSPYDEALDFVERRLWPRFEAARERLLALASEDGIDPRALLEDASRCLSPSDFGFHNALYNDASGQTWFVDFEYAGWDDPAKLVCDFFCQVDVPAPGDWRPEFERRLAPLCPGIDLWRRVEGLLPLYRLKWCAIVLNSFLPAGAARRRFGGHEVTEATLRRDLERARSLAT